MRGFSWGKVLLFGIFLWNLYYFVPYISRSLVKIEKLEKENLEIHKKIEVEKEKIERFSKNIDEMEDDFRREKIARNRLQMVKEQEEIYRFIKN